MRLILGLTGSMGSGKTAVAAMLHELGAEVIDADALARQAVEPGRPALAAIEREFGPGLIDETGRLRRKALADRVFADRAALARLNALVHPEVRSETLRRLETWRGLAACNVVVLDVPLLFESGMCSLTERTLVVVISERERFARLRRRGFSEREIVIRLGMQMPQARKLTRADDVIDNSGPIESTRVQVQNLWDRLTREKSRKDDECQNES